MTIVMTMKEVETAILAATKEGDVFHNDAGFKRVQSEFSGGLDSDLRFCDLIG